MEISLGRTVLERCDWLHSLLSNCDLERQNVNLSANDGDRHRSQVADSDEVLDIFYPDYIEALWNQLGYDR